MHLYYTVLFFDINRWTFKTWWRWVFNFWTWDRTDKRCEWRLATQIVFITMTYTTAWFDCISNPTKATHIPQGLQCINETNLNMIRAVALFLIHATRTECISERPVLYCRKYLNPVDLAKGYHLMTYSPVGVEATAVELQDSARTLCRRNCKLYRLRSA